ncbi:MAG TPA: hypothetical protein VE978_12600 [Chitinophagales bacterium]|nr:hypothetical protein [Chitinophagales bacterium]
MKTSKHMGIWLDHSIAHVMEITNGTIAINSVKSEISSLEKEQHLDQPENLIHAKENHQLSGYYSKLRDTIMNYTEVVLFGPNTAKNELLSSLKVDHQFENIKIEVKHADNMNGNERIAFVRGYFIHD